MVVVSMCERPPFDKGPFFTFASLPAPTTHSLNQNPRSHTSKNDGQQRRGSFDSQHAYEVARHLVLEVNYPSAVAAGVLIE
jgi:hypothetical protein